MAYQTKLGAVHIRWMIRRDMAEVLDIERAVFEYPWFEEEFIRCLRQRTCIGMVAEKEERVIGYMIYELEKTRLDLLNIAVAPDVQRLGVGRAMILKLIGKLSQQRRFQLTTAVRAANLPAQQFFRAMRFIATKVVPDHYDDSDEDMYFFEYDIDPLDCAAARNAEIKVPVS